MKRALQFAFAVAVTVQVILWWRDALETPGPVAVILAGLHLTASIFFAVLAADLAAIGLERLITRYWSRARRSRARDRVVPAEGRPEIIREEVRAI